MSSGCAATFVLWRVELSNTTAGVEQFVETCERLDFPPSLPSCVESGRHAVTADAARAPCRWEKKSRHSHTSNFLRETTTYTRSRNRRSNSARLPLRPTPQPRRCSATPFTHQAPLLLFHQLSCSLAIRIKAVRSSRSCPSHNPFHSIRPFRLTD